MLPPPTHKFYRGKVDLVKNVYVINSPQHVFFLQIDLGSFLLVTESKTPQK